MDWTRAADLEVPVSKRVLLPGMKVECYWNLHHDVWSVRVNGLVRHRSGLVLDDCEFVVQHGGRQRVLREGQKNIHAFVRGTVASVTDDLFDWRMNRITYNPYQHSTFVRVGNGFPVRYAERVVLSSVAGKAKCFALNPEMTRVVFDPWTELGGEG